MLEAVRTILNIIIIPVFAWIISIERRLSRLEGKIDVLIKEINDERKKEDTR